MGAKGVTMQLLPMLQQANALIETLDAENDAAAFADQLLQRRREVFYELPGGRPVGGPTPRR